MVVRDEPYRAAVAWRRAWTFFAACLVLAAATGALQRVVTDEGADRSGAWALWAGLSLVAVLVGYVGLWPRGTFTEDRPRVLGAQVGFGLAWGTSMGLLFLSVHEVVALAGWGPWPTGIVTWLALSAFQGMWHQLWWDLKVSPPHNVARWNPIKVGAAHVPNISLSLVVLIAFGDPRWIVAMQVIALTASAVAMRFPPPSYVRSPDLDDALPALEGR